MSQPEVEVTQDATAEQQASPAQRLGSIKVRVRKVGGVYRAEVPAGARLPKAMAVHGFLKPAARAKVPIGNLRYDSVESAMHESITAGRTTPADWADAIGQAMIQEAVNDNPEGFVAAVAADTASLVELAAGAPAYLAVGDMLFRLTPTAAVDKSGPLAALRAISKERSVAAANALLEAAKSEAQMIRSTAERLKNQAAVVLEKASRTQKFVIPEWLPDNLFLRRNLVHGMVEVRMDGMFAPKRFEIEWRPSANDVARKYEWDCPNGQSYYYKFWIPFHPVSGAYTAERVHMDSEYKPIPHMNNSGLCGGIEGLPKQILSYEELETARKRIVQAMNGFNMGSPLTHVENWDARVRSFIPKALEKFIESHMSSEFMPEAIQSANENQKVVEVLNQTWTR